MSTLLPSLTIILGQLPTAQFSGGHMDWDGGWWLVMGLVMLLVWALVVAALIWLIRTLVSKPDTQGPAQEDPLDILDRRLAEGTIDIEDYETRRRTLRDG
jgi:putative membrane protein